jgi:hypothetical protein
MKRHPEVFALFIIAAGLLAAEAASQVLQRVSIIAQQQRTAFERTMLPVTNEFKLCPLTEATRFRRTLALRLVPFLGPQNGVCVKPGVLSLGSELKLCSQTEAARLKRMFD